MKTLWGREPVMFLAVIQAALACAMGFGLTITPQQMALVMALAGSLLSLIARSQVTPTKGSV